jgi:hypothetical protein
MAVNNALFQNAAKAAFLGGTTANRQNLDAVAADYANTVRSSNAFANAVDQAIPAVGGGGASQSQADQVFAICLGAILNRAPLSQVQTDYNSLAGAIAALYAEAQAIAP